jgi:acyl-coenzyme A synthetase/AMP-(fatty) acid ligase
LKRNGSTVAPKEIEFVESIPKTRRNIEELKARELGT